jgi:hypothetical protein
MGVNNSGEMIDMMLVFTCSLVNLCYLLLLFVVASRVAHLRTGLSYMVDLVLRSQMLYIWTKTDGQRTVNDRECPKNPSQSDQRFYPYP